MSEFDASDDVVGVGGLDKEIDDLAGDKTSVFGDTSFCLVPREIFSGVWLAVGDLGDGSDLKRERCPFVRNLGGFLKTWWRILTESNGEH